MVFENRFHFQNRIRLSRSDNTTNNTPKNHLLNVLRLRQPPKMSLDQIAPWTLR